jgi:hypothetical protein
MSIQEKIIGWTILISVLAWNFVYQANRVGFYKAAKVYLIAIVITSVIIYTIRKIKT